MHQPIYELKELVKDKREAFTDKAVRADMLYLIDQATSFHKHLELHADFYRRQRILANGTKYPTDPVS